MKIYIQERVMAIADYIVATNCTCREAAKKFGVSKDTIHTDMSVRLPLLNKNLHKQVTKIFDINKQEAHLRGGLSTKEKYFLFDTFK